jgi:hypothetical protein
MNTCRFDSILNTNKNNNRQFYYSDVIINTSSVGKQQDGNIDSLSAYVIESVCIRCKIIMLQYLETDFNDKLLKLTANFLMIIILYN